VQGKTWSRSLVEYFSSGKAVDNWTMRIVERILKEIIKGFPTFWAGAATVHEYFHEGELSELP
jgi:hypothetical protein